MDLSSFNFLRIITFCAGLLLFSVHAFAFKGVEDEFILSSANVEVSQSARTGDHQILLSAPMRINNTLVIEKDKRINGDRKVWVMQLSKSENLTEVFKNYQSLLSAQGSVEFVCEKRACGVNSYWANEILDERRVLARDSDQYYLAGYLDKAGQRYWVGVYLVTNALRQNFVYLKLVREEKTANTWHNGYRLNSENLLPVSVAETLKERLKSKPQLKLYLVAYTHSAVVKGEADKRADEVVAFNALEKQAVEKYTLISEQLASLIDLQSSNIHFHMVGPFHSESNNGQSLWFRLFLVEP